MSAPAPGPRPGDAERLAALHAAADAVERAAPEQDAPPPDDPDPDDAGPDGQHDLPRSDPAADADRFEALHDAMLGVLAAADGTGTPGPSPAPDDRTG